MAEDDVNGMEILKKAAEALPDWPLYKPYTFDGDVIMIEPAVHMGGESYQYVLAPREISQLCQVCQQIQRWELIEPKSSGRSPIITALKGQITRFVFRCKNCEK